MVLKVDVTDKVRNVIADFVWENTVGCGFEGDPDIHVVRKLEKVLGRELSHDEHMLFQFKWLEAVQSMGQP